jgi:lipoprotein-releasing system ATP-binding protein
MSKTLIRLANIHKTYQMGNAVIPVLRGVNISLEEGEFVAIMGQSGSGKSTLLHIAGALDRPDRFAPAEMREGAVMPYSALGEKIRDAPVQAGGEVYFRNRPVSEMGLFARHELRNKQIGFVFQFYHLLPELNVLENVLLPAMVEAPFYMAFAGVKPRKDRALQLIESFNLAHRIHHRPAQLSGGERQRAAIARALINEPAVLLADEPTGNLDAKTGRTILDVLVKLHKEQNQTMLLVTHDPNVAALADRTVHLVEGRIRD